MFHSFGSPKDDLRDLISSTLTLIHVLNQRPILKRKKNNNSQPKPTLKCVLVFISLIDCMNYDIGNVENLLKL